MKSLQLFALSILFLASTAVMAQPADLAGSWFGTLNVPGGALRLIFHLEGNGDGYTGEIESIDQGRERVPVNVSIEEDTVVFTNASLDIVYTATVEDSRMTGTFEQLGYTVRDFAVTRQ